MVVVPWDMIRLLKVVNTEAGSVFVSFKLTVPVDGVHVAEPCPTAKEPVINVEPLVIVIVPGLSLLLPEVD